MLRKKTTVVGFLIALLPVALGAIGSAAVSSGAFAAHRVHRVPAAHHRYMPLYGYSIHGQYVPGAGAPRIYGPGYVFVPGHGILGEDCDLPTSTCSNEYRTVK